MYWPLLVLPRSMYTSTESFSHGFELVRSMSASVTSMRTYSLPSDHRVLAVAVASGEGVAAVTLSTGTSLASAQTGSDGSASTTGAWASAGTFTASV